MRRHGPSWLVWIVAVAVIVPGGGRAHAATNPQPVSSAAVPEEAVPYELVGAPASDSAHRTDQPDIQSLIDAAVAALPPPAPVWLCPISSPVRFDDTYGEGRNGGRRHLGVDITAPMGTPTVAPVSGTVRYSRDANGGLSWHLTGEDGVYYYGTHLSRFGSVTGFVTQGTVIGYVGMSGDASLPHLHLEIHPGGLGSASINPTPTAAKYCNNTLPR